MSKIQELEKELSALRGEVDRLKQRDMYLYELNLPKRLRRVINDNTDCKMVSDLSKHSRQWYAKLPKAGRKTLYDLDCLMSKFGVDYAADEQPRLQ